MFVISWCVCPWKAFPAMSNKHSRLLGKAPKVWTKCFVTLGPSANLIKRLRLQFTNVRNKLECLSMKDPASLSNVSGYGLSLPK